MNIRNNQNSLLARISGRISANAANLQRLDLARLGRRLEAARQFQYMIADLKQQIAQKPDLRAQVSLAINGRGFQSLAA